MEAQTAKKIELKIERCFLKKFDKVFENRKKSLTFLSDYYKMIISAEIAQLVEHFTRNEGVEGSSPFFSLAVKS